MAGASFEDLTDALASACLAYDARKVKAALKRGACPNRPTHLGNRPVHMLIDPGNAGTDLRQARCLALLLEHGVELGHKHKFIYTACERISMFLPHCARAVIEHAGGLPAEVLEMEPEHHSWWQGIHAHWKAAKEASLLQASTPGASGSSEPRRI